MPMSVGAITGTTYQLNPDANVFSSHDTLTGTSYQVDGAVEPLVGSVTGTSYEVESGSSFAYYCGDGFRDPLETCDGNNLNSQTCVTQGFDSGTLACASDCASFDTSSCSSGSPPAPGGGGGGGAASPATSGDLAVDGSLEEMEFTFGSSILLFGEAEDGVDGLEINGEDVDGEYDGEDWQAEVALSYGLNTFTIEAFDGQNSIDEIDYEIYRRLVGDVNGDDVVNDYDLSLLIGFWGDDSREGDFNEDEAVDDYDFSMMVARWGVRV